jgi:hypothetical protein
VLGAAPYVQGEQGPEFEPHEMDDPRVIWQIFGVHIDEV